MRLATILDPTCVVLDVGAGSAREVLARLAGRVAARRPDLDADRLLVELLRREQECSTAIADGIAIPHARPAVDGPVTAALGIAPGGIDFDSLDGRPTFLLVVLVSPASQPEAHARWLAHVARVLSDAPTRNALLAARSEDQAMEVLAQREAGLGAAGGAA